MNCHILRCASTFSLLSKRKVKSLFLAWNKAIIANEIVNTIEEKLAVGKTVIFKRNLPHR